MKAYIAYSLSEDEQYFVSILAIRFGKQNFFTDGSQFDYEGDTPGFRTRNKIKNSHLFLGILTKDGDEFDFVYKEWLYALKVHIPAILLIEDELLTLNPQLKDHPNILVFNRSNPEATINQINQNIKEAASKQEGKPNDSLAWMIGGFALTPLVRLLSEQKQEAA